MKDTLELREFFLIIKKSKKMIIIITLLCSILSALLSFYVIKPTYEANATLIVNQNMSKNNSDITGDDINVTQQLAITYGEIIKSRNVLDSVIDELKLPMDYSEIKKLITVSTIENTQIININVQYNNPKIARDIANSIPSIFRHTLKRITNISSVEVIDYAALPSKPIKPNKILNIIIATLLGIMISIFGVFLREYLDIKLKTPEEVEDILGLPIIGVIPFNEDIE
ncbi:YveK family protein [[Clostridium] dakarense]|uniref:YveK family protein n=1 Tax=Faecalimicrobium dakarense TaxID=1301100 RepID=UPI0005AB675C|nr:Wzz/FepE/Etk N-terminal domain-containing protein [[Clostridium] dakarense]